MNTVSPNSDTEDRPEASHPFHDVPVEILISVGRARLPIADLLALDEDSVVEMDRHSDDVVDLHAGGRLIATGTLEEGEDGTGRLVVRISSIRAAAMAATG